MDFLDDEEPDRDNRFNDEESLFIAEFLVELTASISDNKSIHPCSSALLSNMIDGACSWLHRPA